MECIGVHCKLKEPTAWVNSMHVVYKLGKTCVCLDPEDLNQYIMREHCPMPTVEEVEAHMSGATIFSCIDASSGYWCSIEEEFGDIEGAEIIVDNLVVWGQNNEEHDNVLSKSKVCTEIRIKIEPKKMQV